MSDPKLNVLGVVGSLNAKSVTRVVVGHVVEILRTKDCEADVLDFGDSPLPMFDPEKSYASPEFQALQTRVEAADVFLLGTPDYHGCMSGVMKNFLDHFWTEFAGKLFATVVASHEKGLTATDQLRTTARQCYAWSMPYAVSFVEKADVKDGRIVSESFGKRIEMFARDVHVYGEMLAAQRRKDLAGTGPGFLARYRQ